MTGPFPKAIVVDAAGTLFSQDVAAPEGVRLFDDCIPFLLALQKRHFGPKTGLITNWGMRIHRVLEATRLRDSDGSEFPLSACFNVVVCIDDVHYGKPHPEPFQLAVNSLQLDPKDCLFIGDSLRDDVFGAMDAGLQALWLNRRNVSLGVEMERMLGASGHPVCTDFTAVMCHLQNLQQNAPGSAYAQ